MNGMDGVYSASAIRGINLGSLDPRPDGPDPLKEFLSALGQLSDPAGEPGARAAPATAEPDGSAAGSPPPAVAAHASAGQPVAPAVVPAALEVPPFIGPSASGMAEPRAPEPFPPEPSAPAPQPPASQAPQPEALVDLGAVLAARPVAGLVERFSFGASG
jgi:hypothetical protein